MKGRGRSVACDWVGRSLYWLEESADRHQSNAVIKYDLHGSPRSPTTSVVLLRPTSVTLGSIHVDPSRRYLTFLFT